MNSYLKYKEYYDRQLRAAPLKEKDKERYCFVLQLKADHQGSKSPFRDYRWVGPFIVQKVLSKENYLVRRLNTNRTHLLYLIRLKKLVPNQSLEDSYREERLQPDEDIIFPQDDLYTITWKTNSGEQLATRCCHFIPSSLLNSEESITSNDDANDAHENGADYIITRDSPNDNPDTAQQRNERFTMTSAKEMKLLKRKKMRTLIGRIRPFNPKIKKNLCRICLKDRKTMPSF